MHLAVVVERWDPAGSDPERWAVEIATHLARCGHSLEIIAARQGDHAPVPEGIRLTLWPRLYVGYPRHLQAYAAWAREQLARTSADVTLSFTALAPAQVLHFLSGTIREAAAHEPKVKSHPIQFVLDRIFHQPREHLATLLELENRTVREAKVRLVLSPNADTSEQYVTHYGLPRERLRVLPPGVDVPVLDADAAAGVRRAWGIAVDAPVYLYPVRALRPELLRALLEAWREVVRRAPRAVLLAAGELTYAIQHHAVAADLRENIRLIPTTYRREELIAAGDVVVVPTPYAGCSRSVLLALAAGVPVVASGGDGAADYLRDPTGAASGRVVEDPADSRELAAAMVEMLDPAVRARSRASGPHWRRQLSLEQHVASLEVILRGL